MDKWKIGNRHTNQFIQCLNCQPSEPETPEQPEQPQEPRESEQPEQPRQSQEPDEPEEKDERIGFKITKEVRIGDSGNYSNKVENVKSGEIVKFRIEVKNTGDKDGKELLLIDELPKELEKVSGDLTTDIDRLNDGQTKTYYIEARIKESIYSSGMGGAS